MALLDVFKKKTEEKGGTAKTEKAVNLQVSKKSPAEQKIKAKKISAMPSSEIREPSQSKEEKKERSPIKKVEKSKAGQGYRILKMPRISEKATDLAEKNQYLFEVYQRANKNEIKQAIRDLYGVDPVSVRIINMPRKKRRLGRIEGFRPGYKKAIVKIGEGHKIEVLPR